MKGLLLASASPRRRELLAILGTSYDTTVTYVPEIRQADEAPSRLAARLSRAKSQAAFEAHHRGISKACGTIIIGCDTVVAVEGEVLGKPEDTADAEAMLRRLRGRSHEVYSALSLLDGTEGRILTDIAETQVAMRDYSDQEMASYIASGDPFDKAGAYAIQHSGFHPVLGLHGCYASVMGLPLCHLARGLGILGFPTHRNVPMVCQEHLGIHCSAHQEVLAGEPKARVQHDQ